MKVAIALFKNSIAPRLDICDSLLVYHLGKASVIGKEKSTVEFDLPGQLVAYLENKNIQAVLCSSAPRIYLKTLETYHIKVIYDVKGDPDELVEKLLNGDFGSPLPGIGKKYKNYLRSVNMEVFKITKKDFFELIDKKIWEKKSRMVGVMKRGAHYVYADLSSSKELDLNYDVTILPPKKYFQPQKEILLKFVPKKVDSYVAVHNCEPITVVGIHYYDLAALYMMDKAFSDGERDEHYLRRRKNSLLIGLFPTKHYQYRFSRSVVKDQYYKVADLMLIDMGKEYAVEIVSEKGKKFLEGAKVKKSEYSIREIDEAKNRIKDDRKLPVPYETTGDYLEENYNHPAWKYFGDKCFSCGSCVLVCPTCYCFDVREEIDLTLKEGKRVRVWDGCMLEDFASVADGHNFRRDRSDRFRHRIFRKGKYLPEKYHYFGCVGCGRCADACTADIAGPVKVLKYIKENQ